MNMSLPDFNSPYLNNQLIAYIGNKRRLLRFLAEVFADLAGRCYAGRGASSRASSGTGAAEKPLRFGDCFAGSGSVSRLAKSMGFSLASNDWEMYSCVINTAHLRLSETEADRLFGGSDALAAEFERLNSLKHPAKSDSYISRYYAPADTASADYKRERLFYTRENALFIDAVRGGIEKLFPGWDLSEDDFIRKCILTAPLLYQAATHANTNGVFKACHKGFGGHGKDALKRIMAPMALQKPHMIEGGAGCRADVTRLDAAVFAERFSEQNGCGFDICYLDPPYNQHQYGSNYFMLNTIALWDKPEVSMERTSEGVLKVKAGIREDWSETRSNFCYRKTAPAELRRLIDNIDARYIVLSYNTEGIIPFDELFDILSSFGKVEIFCRDYVIYRGGRQSLGRVNRNVEFQLVLSKYEKPGSGDRSAVDKVLRARSIISLMNESFVPARLKEEFNTEDGRIELVRGGRLNSAADEVYRFSEIPDIEALNRLPQDELIELQRRLEVCRCKDRCEEAEVLMSLISGWTAEMDKLLYKRYWTALFGVIRKFAFRKYRDTFEKIFTGLEELYKSELALGKPGNWKFVQRKIEELRRIAELRCSDPGA